MPELIRAGDIGFIHGLGPGGLDKPGKALAESVEEQGAAIVANLDSLLAAHGLDRRAVLTVAVHLTQFRRFHARLERALAGQLVEAVSWTGVEALPRDALVQMDFVVDCRQASQGGGAR